MKIVASNKKAYFNFEILKKFETGIVLKGWQVKSIKSGAISLAGAYVKEQLGEFFLVGALVTKLRTAYSSLLGLDKDTYGMKLLLKRSEIILIRSRIKEKGLTCVPLELYINNSGLIKLTIALVRGKKKYDKRESLKQRDLKNRIDQERKKYNF